MSKNTILESLNKGVPVYAPVNIRQIDLINNSENPELVESVIQKNFEKYMEFLSSIAPASDLDIFTTMMVIIDEQTLEKKLIFSPTGFISSLVYNLNYNNICRKIEDKNIEHITLNKTTLFEELKKSFKERIEVLKNIKTHKKFMKEFPFLYSIYEKQRELSATLKELKKKIEMLPATERKECIKNFEKEQRKNIPHFNFNEYLEEYSNITIEVFIKKYIQTLNALIDNIDKVNTYLLSSYIDLNEMGTDDKEKIELFLASQYLFEAEVANENKKQDYLYYVSNYFASNPNIIDSNLYITLGVLPTNIPNYSIIQDKKGYVMTPKDLYERYRQILIDNPNLRAIDFSHLDFTGLTASEVKKFMDEYLKDLSANWDLLEPEDKSYEEEIIKKIKLSGKEMIEEDQVKHQQKLLELFMEKKRLYDSSDPFFRVKGKDTFDGYIGYIYKNGRVVLDKFYDDAATGRLADGHAVYAMGIQEFYEISKLSKTEIIRRKLCNRYIHTGEWAKRVLEKEINAPSSNNPVALVRKLIKKGEINPPEDSAI